MRGLDAPPCRSRRLRNGPDRPPRRSTGRRRSTDRPGSIRGGSDAPGCRRGAPNSSHRPGSPRAGRAHCPGRAGASAGRRHRRTNPIAAIGPSRVPRRRRRSNVRPATRRDRTRRLPPRPAPPPRSRGASARGSLAGRLVVSPWPSFAGTGAGSDVLAPAQYTVRPRLFEGREWQIDLDGPAKWGDRFARAGGAGRLPPSIATDLPAISPLLSGDDPPPIMRGFSKNCVRTGPKPGPGATPDDRVRRHTWGLPCASS